jgi:putative protein-disulfide isomerase
VGKVHVSYYTDPACPWSWAAEPALRRLQAEFGADLDITYIMGGLAREFRRPLETMRHTLDAGEASGMPVDPRLWLDHPPRSSYPACQAVKAAAEQGLDGPYLRVVREGLMARRQKLDTADTLIAAARGVAGMDVARFAVDLHSAAIVEAFGADLERARAAALNGEPRVAFPSFAFRGEDGAEHWARDETSPAAVHAVALAAGASPAAGGLPGAEEALRRFTTLATPEVAAACDLPGPRAPAELWRLAAEFRARPERLLTGELWSAAA